MNNTKKILNAAADLWTQHLMRGDHERFKQALLTELETRMKSSLELTVSTDYDPDETLTAALNAAGIHIQGGMFTCDGLLPRKSVMSIFLETGIEVKWGYGQPWNVIEIKDMADVG